METPVKSAKKDKNGVDKRKRLVDATMRRYGHASHALIETLHTVQEVYGYLDDDALKYVAQQLRIPLSKVLGVATFYHFFTLKPQGKHNCVICTGTACYIKGVPAMMDKIKEVYSIGPGETTGDDKLSLLTARCIGSCGMAPAVVLDGDVAGKISPDDLIARIGSMIKNDV
jgi:bidirectional [NiFe] hydrogenase diaphorase subunit